MIITPPVDIVAPKPSVILHPGIRALADNVERYVAEGGGSVIIEVGAGDVIEVIDLEGCLLYTSPSPRDKRQSRMPSSA